MEKCSVDLQCRRCQFDSWVGKIPWRRDRLPTPVFLAFPGGLDGKESSHNAGDLESMQVEFLPVEVPGKPIFA